MLLKENGSAVSTEKEEVVEKPRTSNSNFLPSHVLCVDTGRSSETAKAHRG
eukprot:TRINITY_DN500_c0_g2_i5.p2 TRINITY_DN500_c0_g2~~TRINITY_DN500_c0_g2_i5.p2  ORF type:complete len:51 (-),score=23.98 TRINITY_DN500_c0_g2_i5:2-154(-)